MARYGAGAWRISSIPESREPRQSGYDMRTDAEGTNFENQSIRRTRSQGPVEIREAKERETRWNRTAYGSHQSIISQLSRVDLSN